MKNYKVEVINELAKHEWWNFMKREAKETLTKIILLGQSTKEEKEIILKDLADMEYNLSYQLPKNEWVNFPQYDMKIVKDYEQYIVINVFKSQLEYFEILKQEIGKSL